MRCYEQCLKLNDKNRVLWIEYGNFTYNLHSFCSRCLKQNNLSFSIDYFEFLEDKKDKCIDIAHNAFTTLVKLAEERKQVSSSREGGAGENGDGYEGGESGEEEDHGQDEMWLYAYMLGKISEKKREEPHLYLNHYSNSSKFLYESGATYPLKINHGNPSTLSIEALEVFYRINAAIIKYLEQHPKVERATFKTFNNMLKHLAESPFAFNRAKIKSK